MMTLADFIARHAVLILFAVAIVLLAFTAVLWRTLNRYAPRAWRLATNAWNALRNSAFAGRARRIPGVAHVLEGTLTAGRYFGVFAMAGFLLAAGGIALFFEIADEIGVNESLARFDAALSVALSEHLSQATLQAFALITTLGDPEFLIGLGALVAVALAILRRWMLMGAWIVATISGGLLNQALKAIFERARPLHEHGLVSETSFSFPSGHAAGSMLVYGLLGYLIVRHTRSAWHVPAALVAMALVIFVGSSRVLLQVHYFSDVLAGYASAAAWLALWIAGLETLRWREGSRAD